MLAKTSVIDLWQSRTPYGPYDSPKSLLALEYCIGRGILWTLPTTLHGEGITEFDSTWDQMSLKIVDDGQVRHTSFVGGANVNDRVTTTIKGCI